MPSDMSFVSALNDLRDAAQLSAFEQRKIQHAFRAASGKTVHAEDMAHVVTAQHFQRRTFRVGDAVGQYVKIIAVMSRQPKVMDHDQRVFPERFR